MSIKAYKGFNKDMTCRGFQFKEGETYHEDKAKLCEKGFHACLDPLDCFDYYNPAESVFHEVELDDAADEKSEDSKICGKTIKIGAKLDIAGLIKTQLEIIKSKTNNKQITQGDWSVASTHGDWSVASTQGNRSVASTQGDWSVGVSTGCNSSVTGCKGSISVGWGIDNKCKGDIGSYIVLVERGKWDGAKYPQIGEPKLKKVDGKIIKPDTWYTLKDGKFVEVKDSEK